MSSTREAALDPLSVARNNAERRAFFADRRVLITGAGGSIGSALARRIASLGCTRLGLLDHFDHALMEVVEEIHRDHPAVSITELLCDVRMPARMRACFDLVRPDVVIHAAALKHVDLGERHPGECVLTNLGGVRVAAEAAAGAGCGLFVLISSDKAASPVCTMGASKRLAELYLEGFRRDAAAGLRPRMACKAVRFGNVYGTQGSVVPKFLAQIERGGPVELTDQRMQRYFMSLQQAVDLILHVAAAPETDAACVGAHVLDMGQPVSILALARQLIAERGSDAKIVITGLRPGEKLFEELYDEHEAFGPSALDGVHRITPRSPEAAVFARDVLELEELALRVDGLALRQRVFAMLNARLGRREALVG